MSEHSGDAELQFETVTPPPLPGAVTASAGVSCAVCQASIPDEYFDVNGQSVCRVCRVRVLEAGVTPKGWGILLRAAACGLAAAIAGAGLYYAVIAITDFGIGLVAIAIGYMVGYAVRFGARGRGGRRFQVLAMVLTYVAVSLAYSVIAIRASLDDPATETTLSTSTPAAPVASSTGQAEGAAGVAEAEPAEEAGAGGFAVSLALIFGFFLALPVIVVFSSLPGGLISAAIIVFGMLQAWRMTMAPVLNVSGPYRVGTGALASSGA